MKTQENSPENSLLRFMSEMNAWEVKFHKLYQPENGGPELHQATARVALSDIYATYVTEKDRKTGRMAGPSTGYPPEFDVNAEKIEKVETTDEKKSLITTIWTHPAVASMTEMRRYTMVRIASQWKLDKKEVFRKTKDKWENRVL
jgi:NTF2 fold immunity protein